MKIVLKVKRILPMITMVGYLGLNGALRALLSSFQCYLIQCLCPLIICFPYLEGRLFVNLSELRYEQFFHSLLLRLSQTSEDMVLAKLASALLSAI